MSIQILHYEFLGPINLEEWGPPMEKVVYLILARQKDSFHIIYANDCEKTEDKSFFTNNSNFKCWIQTAGSEKLLHLAILPLFDDDSKSRKNILSKIIARYKPVCNSDDESTKPPDYVTRSSSESNSENTNTNSEKTLCPCCGSEMKVDKVLENTTIIRCIDCGLSDSKLNS